MCLSKSRNERIGFRRIICLLDLTQGSEEALHYGVALAKDYGAKLRILHCVDEEKVVDLAERKQLKGRLEGFVREHAREQIHEVDWDSLLIDGEPSEAIAAEAARRSADLIVMRSKRRPNSAAALLGSTAAALSRLAPCPVLVSHPFDQSIEPQTASRTTPRALKRLLVAYDYSIDSELALAYGLSLGQEYGAEVHLLHVLPERPPRRDIKTPELSFLPYSSDQVFEEALARLTSAVSPEAYACCSIRQTLREGQPYREALKYADEEKIDLICIGASGTGHGMRALFGSNTDRVLRQSPCPVFIARPLRPMQHTVHD